MTHRNMKINNLLIACFLLITAESFQPIHSNARPSASGPSDAVKATPGIIKPGESFRNTESGELSVCSFNMLAPAYHWIGHEDAEQMKARDRQARIPLSIAMAKQSNADILLLQEVEGGEEEFELRLKQLLSTPIGDIEGYDEYIWAALHPNRRGDLVGLAVAWRSNKHMLISSDEFRRGIVVQLEQLGSGSTFCVGNVHLPAKPADIEGRLKTMATTIRKADGCESPMRRNPLDGTIIIGGDFNCDQNSPTVHLLTTGSSMHGTLRDRNYKAKISKDEAAKMRHRHRFKDIYANELREAAAPVTVSLHGRGPGCMDHMLYSSGSVTVMASSRSDTLSAGSREGKRKSRRLQAQARVTAAAIDTPLPLRVECVLATIDPADPVRTELILSGLPLFDKGFPSDHLPIGALFVPEANFEPLRVNKDGKASLFDASDLKSGGLGGNARRRQDSYQKSVVVRKRHNAVLRAVSEWVISRGAVEVIRDQPLYKWKWTKDVENLGKKMRAPDLCCVIGNSLVIIEVTVANNPDAIRREKELKYDDLSSVLGRATAVLEAGLVVPTPFIIVLGENGDTPEVTQACLDDIALLSSDPSCVFDPMEGKRISAQLRRVLGDLYT
jgi:cap-snatching RNA endonuclease